MNPPDSLLKKYKSSISLISLNIKDIKYNKRDKKFILNTTNNFCYYCLDKKLNTNNVVIDYYISFAMNGDSSYINLVPSCKECAMLKKQYNIEGLEFTILKSRYARCIAINDMGKRCNITDKNINLFNKHKCVLCPEHKSHNIPDYMLPSIYIEYDH